MATTGSSVLDRILEAKRAAVDAARRERPLEQLRELADAAPPARPFRDALLAASPIALIAELKKASPSAGLLRADFDVEYLARRYTEAGAAALSVITETDFFLGRPEFIAQAKAASALPVLRKDFIIDEYQIIEARAIGADAVLLIAAALDTETLHRFCETARAAGLHTLLEIHDEAELARVEGVPCDILGVNNRNLKTMQVDIETSIRLAPALAAAPCRISESGVSTPAHARALAAAGFNGILIGTSLVKQPDPAPMIRSLLDFKMENITVQNIFFSKGAD